MGRRLTGAARSRKGGTCNEARKYEETGRKGQTLAGPARGCSGPGGPVWPDGNGGVRGIAVRLRRRQEKIYWNINKI